MNPKDCANYYRMQVLTTNKDEQSNVDTLPEYYMEYMQISKYVDVVKEIFQMLFFVLV